VGEDALTFQIQALRQALGDDARCPRYIETVHRVGYRFIAPTGVGVSEKQPPAAMGWYEAEVHRLATELLRLLEARQALAG
jgi:DNA-binding winged helix-turn-helix (wHTH) protein